MQINAIIKNELNFQNNHIIPLTLYYKYIDLRIKYIDVIMLAPDNIKRYLININFTFHYGQWLTQIYISYK